VLTLNSTHHDAIVAACIRALPNEGCGLLLGTLDGVVVDVLTSVNVADSAKAYEIDPGVLLRAYRRADEEGIEVLGVFHSHTHSEAFPSSTDIDRAPDPSWHYVIVSLRDLPLELRSFRVLEGNVTSEPVEVVD
jgi:proteasome lid subunit RPN8/RPN11